jgi:hypothetical protein
MADLYDEKGRLKVSASQILSFRNCKRFWYINKVLGIPTEETPALLYGKNFHSCIEKTYELLDQGLAMEEIRTAIKDLFVPEITNMVIKGWTLGILTLPKKRLIEQEIKIPIGDYGVMRGFIDFINVDESRIEDHKTIGNWQYALKEQDLEQNLQLMIYAYWYFRKIKNKKEVYIRHNQFYKSNPSDSKFIVKKVYKDHVCDYWEENVVKLVSEMVEYAKIQDVKEVEVNLKHCGAYGGCCFKGDPCDQK